MEITHFNTFILIVISVSVVQCRHLEMENTNLLISTIEKVTESSTETGKLFPNFKNILLKFMIHFFKGEDAITGRHKVCYYF